MEQKEEIIVSTVEKDAPDNCIELPKEREVGDGKEEDSTECNKKSSLDTTTADEDVVGDPPDEDEQGEKADEDGELEDSNVTAEKGGKPLDHDQDKRNPQYIPKGGAFYEHDNRTMLEIEDTEEEPKTKLVWKQAEQSERWLHDKFIEDDQEPRSKDEIVAIYGYDIREEDGPPRPRRSKKYSRGPEKYVRNWQDERAYQVKSNVSRTSKRTNSRSEFPALKHENNEKRNIFNAVEQENRTPNVWETRKTEAIFSENSTPNKPFSKGPPSRPPFPNNSNNSDRNRAKNWFSNDRSVLVEDHSHIKPFKTDSNPKVRDEPGPLITKPNQLERNKNITKVTRDDRYNDVQHLVDDLDRISIRPKGRGIESINSIVEKVVEKPKRTEEYVRKNPKRYSNISKGFLFQPEDTPELGAPSIRRSLVDSRTNKQPVDAPSTSFQQAPSQVGVSVDITSKPQISSNPAPPSPAAKESVGSFSNNPPYISPPPVLQQQALSPQGSDLSVLPFAAPLPQQLPPPNFVPDATLFHLDYPNIITTPFTNFPPYSPNQPSEVYQSPSGITYYSPEIQAAGPPPSRRPNAAIPIVSPPE